MLPFTVADDNIAKINQAYYNDLDIDTKVSLPQRVGWAVRKNSKQLLDTLNYWIKKAKKGSDYHVIYNKYFKNQRAFTKRMKSNYYSYKKGSLSPYDQLIKKHAKTINWDWRLLASLIYQESQFKPKRESWAGAKGLMQVTDRTFKQFGSGSIYDPVQNIEAGTKFIKWLQDYWKEIPDSENRIKFILASYNAGQGHIQDARRLAKKNGKNTNIWDGETAPFILLKANKSYYNDPVVKYGYARGTEPFNYVNEILERFGIYQRLVTQ